jgi:hypothetical protein
MLDALHADVEDPGLLGDVPRRLSGVLLARRGLPGAEQWLAPLLAEALRQPDRVLGRSAGDARALVEWCWLDDRAEVCRPLADALLAWGSPDLDAAELVRWLLRAGLIERDAVAPIPGLPEAHAAGWRGDWRAAADAWKRVGAPYERGGAPGTGAARRLTSAVVARRVAPAAAVTTRSSGPRPNSHRHKTAKVSAGRTINR